MSESKLVFFKPTLEHVIPWKRYQLEQPKVLVNNELYDDKEGKLILYGGGREFLLRDIDRGEEVEVEVYILEGRLMLWIKHPDINKGVEIPNSSIIYHGSRINYEGRDGHRLELVVSVCRDKIIDELFGSDKSRDTDIYGGTVLNGGNELNAGHEGSSRGVSEELPMYTLSSVELVLRPKYSSFDRYYSEEIEQLFTFDNFGLNRGDDLIENCHNQLALSIEHSAQEEEVLSSDNAGLNEQPGEPTSMSTLLNSMNSTNGMYPTNIAQSDQRFENSNSDTPVIGNTGNCDDLDDMNFGMEIGDASSFAIEQNQLNPASAILGRRSRDS